MDFASKFTHHLQLLQLQPQSWSLLAQHRLQLHLLDRVEAVSPTKQPALHILTAVCFVLPVCCAGAVLPRNLARARASLIVQATAAPARPASPATADVDTTLTPKALGFTMPGEQLGSQLRTTAVVL